MEYCIWDGMVAMKIYGFLWISMVSFMFFGHLEHVETGHAFAQDVLDATTAIATEIHGHATGPNTAPNGDGSDRNLLKS